MKRSKIQKEGTGRTLWYAIGAAQHLGLHICLKKHVKRGTGGSEMAEPKKPFYRDRKWKLGGSFGVWHIPYCPHCKRQLGLMAEEQQAEKCPMCGKMLDWGKDDV